MNTALRVFEAHHLGPSFLVEDFDNGESFPQEENKNTVLLPFLGKRASCGLFGISDDFLEKYQSLDARFVKNKASTFFLRAESDSMLPLIAPHDILVVDRSLENFQGKICIVAFEGQLLCKRIFKGQDFVELRSENQKYKPIRVYDSENVSIWGVVIARASEMK